MENIEISQFVYLCFGGNIGDTKHYIIKAIKELEKVKGIKLEKQSSFWLTEPQGYGEQNWFINCVCAFACSEISPYGLLDKLQEIEYSFGRKRMADNQNAPRTLDIDILDFQGIFLEEKRLILPHPRMKQRAFVLVPLREIAPDYLFVSGQSIHEALGEIEFIIVKNKIYQQ